MSEFVKKDRRARSDSYQYLMNEISVEDFVLDKFLNEQGLYAELNPYHYNELYAEIKDKIKQRFWELAKTHCTDRQYTVLQMTASGMTQEEMADTLKVNQSSINKTLRGSDQSYIKGSRLQRERLAEKPLTESEGAGNLHRRRRKSDIMKYGGAITKLRKLVREDPVLAQLLEDLENSIPFA